MRLEKINYIILSTAILLILLMLSGCGSTEELDDPDNTQTNDLVASETRSNSNTNANTKTNKVVMKRFGESTEGFVWLAVGDELIISNYTGSMSDLEIPDKIDGIAVSSIGSMTFEGDSNIKSVSLPKTVKSIGYSAFNNCKNLEEIRVDKDNSAYKEQDSVLFSADMKTLLQFPVGSGAEQYTVPEGVEVISAGAFAECATLKSINLPTTLKEIEFYAFEECVSLESISLPASLEKIGTGAFTECLSLKRISVHESNGHFKSENGILFSADGKSLIQYPENLKIKSYKIPEGVERIMNSAFYDSPLHSVSFPQSLTRIERYAFSGSANLRTIELPASLSFIGSYAFGWCDTDKVIVNAEEPAELGKNALSFHLPNRKIFVPAKSFSNYINHPDWAEYASNIHAK